MNHDRLLPGRSADEDDERVVVTTLEKTPQTPLTGQRVDWPKSWACHRRPLRNIWRSFGIKPWLDDEFKLSNDPLFIEKVRDFVGFYQFPPDAAAVFCVDETTQIQALDRTAPILPLLPRTSP